MGPPLGNILQKRSYLAMIKNAEGTKLFRTVYANIDGQEEDICFHHTVGARSCAVLVSSILYLWRLIDTTRATVASLEEGLVDSGWRKTDTPSEGDIVFWDLMLQNGEESTHAGFYLGADEALSNDWKTGVPIRHHLTYGTKEDGSPVRNITAYYTHDFVS